MRIEIDRVRPRFLADPVVERSEIWGRSHVLAPGCRWVVHGPSGRGKSTFLRILFGLERRFSGTLSIDGEPVSGEPFRLWPRLRFRSIAFVPQEFLLFGDSDGWANLARLPRHAENVDADRIAAWADRLGILPQMARPTDTWSLGQRQRLAILRALAAPFSFLLLDEPFSNLDPDSAESALGLVEEVSAEREAGWILTAQTGRQRPHARDYLAV